MPGKSHRLLAAALAGVVVAAGAAVPALAADTVPKLGWYKCFDVAECATVDVPLDYDQPRGAQIELGVLRIKAKDQAHKIGSLFVNPGGPGGSATQFALAAPDFLSDALQRRFDVVGVDPRGIGASTQVTCFDSVKDQTEVLNQLNVPFPVTEPEQRRFVKGSEDLGEACSTTGKEVAGSMSTAEVARDMDVVREALGEKKLTYLGFSYGSLLGQYYANMFPEGFRALVVDGVLDPRAWVGSDTRQILDARLHSADGSHKALIEILKRCGKAGKKYCEFASSDPVRDFDTVTHKLREKPLEMPGGTVTYAAFIAAIQSALYAPDAGEQVTQIAAQVENAQKSDSAAALSRFDFPYNNGLEAGTSVICTDGLHPRDAASWPAAVARRDREAPYFGAAWGWLDSACARDTWTVRDEDAYTGPFDQRTDAPVLVVGSIHDPATNYRGAVAASRLLPNARLLSSNNWGHTGYGRSACVTAGVDRYLMTGKPPARGTFCTDAPQPFTKPVPQAFGAPSGKRLPPITTPAW